MITQTLKEELFLRKGELHNLLTEYNDLSWEEDMNPFREKTLRDLEENILECKAEIYCIQEQMQSVYN